VHTEEINQRRLEAQTHLAYNPLEQSIVFQVLTSAEKFVSRRPPFPLTARQEPPRNITAKTCSYVPFALAALETGGQKNFLQVTEVLFRELLENYVCITASREIWKAPQWLAGKLTVTRSRAQRMGANLPSTVRGSLDVTAVLRQLTDLTEGKLYPPGSDLLGDTPVLAEVGEAVALLMDSIKSPNWADFDAVQPEAAVTEAIEVELEWTEVSSPLRSLKDRLEKSRFSHPKKDIERARLATWLNKALHNKDGVALAPKEMREIVELLGSESLAYVRWVLAMELTYFWIRALLTIQSVLSRQSVQGLDYGRKVPSLVDELSEGCQLLSEGGFVATAALTGESMVRFLDPNFEEPPKAKGGKRAKKHYIHPQWKQFLSLCYLALDVAQCYVNLGSNE
jgi:hypothetical protein